MPEINNPSAAGGQQPDPKTAELSKKLDTYYQVRKTLQQDFDKARASFNTTGGVRSEQWYNQTVGQLKRVNATIEELETQLGVKNPHDTYQGPPLMVNYKRSPRLKAMKG